MKALNSSTVLSVFVVPPVDHRRFFYSAQLAIAHSVHSVFRHCTSLQHCVRRLRSMWQLFVLSHKTDTTKQHNCFSLCITSCCTRPVARGHIAVAPYRVRLRTLTIGKSEHTESYPPKFPLPLGDPGPHFTHMVPCATTSVCVCVKIMQAYHSNMSHTNQIFELFHASLVAGICMQHGEIFNIQNGNSRWPCNSSQYGTQTAFFCAYVIIDTVQCACRVCATVGHPTSICSVQQPHAAACLLLWAWRPGDIHWLLHGQQQACRSMTHRLVSYDTVQWSMFDSSVTSCCCLWLVCMNVFADQVKRKLELDGIGEFKAPRSKCIRSCYVASDICSSYMGEPCIWCFRGCK